MTGSEMANAPHSSSAGTSVNPYDYIAGASKHLASQPRDIGVRGKLAEAFLLLGCPELALEQLLALAEDASNLQGLEQAIARVRSAPPSRVPHEVLQQQLDANLALCHDRWPERGSLWSNLHLPQELEVFRFADGNLQARFAPANGTVVQFPIVGHREAAAIKLPAQVAHTVHDGFLVCSLSLGEQVLWLFGATRDGLNGLQQTLILVEPELDNLAINLAFRPWGELLQAPRVRLFAGPDFLGHLTEAIRTDHSLPVPAYVVSLPTWPNTQPADTDVVLKSMMEARHEVVQQFRRRVDELYEGRDQAYWADRFARAGSHEQPPLRVVGPTSLMTAVLQYSMRDWVAAFEQLGCQTRLLVEPGHHCTLTPASYLQAILDFEPDLFVLHDHARHEFERWFPPNLPILSWIQDRMPKLFSAGVGAKMGPLDFVTGIGKKECVVLYGYPFERFLSMPSLTSERTYYPLPAGQGTDPQYECDVCYVSHAGMPVEQLVDRAVYTVEDPRVRKVVEAVVRDLVQRCGQGRFIFNRDELAEVLQRYEEAAGIRLDTDHGREGVLQYLLLQFNSPLIRQSVAGWLAESDLCLHLYGQGWDRNPRFARFARGVAANGDQLRQVFQGAKINLQVQPFGAVHSRLLDGVASGGFFLIHACPVDQVGQTLRQLHRYVEQAGIGDCEALLNHPDPQVQEWIGHVKRCTGWDLRHPHFDLLVTLRYAANADFVGFGDAVIPHYHDVAFSSKQELLEKVEYFLAHEQERARLTREMREGVMRRFSYRDGTRRMLEFVKRTLVASSKPSPVSADV
ncbi:MAG TPA: glycosyltransferase [Phycisphaerae bacterium]|nr:glycosyltransferase [Phycisphaerae bacterium]